MGVVGLGEILRKSAVGALAHHFCGLASVRGLDGAHELGGRRVVSARLMEPQIWHLPAPAVCVGKKPQQMNSGTCLYLNPGESCPSSPHPEPQQFSTSLVCPWCFSSICTAAGTWNKFLLVRTVLGSFKRMPGSTAALCLTRHYLPDFHHQLL